MTLVLMTRLVNGALSPIVVSKKEHNVKVLSSIHVIRIAWVSTTVKLATEGRDVVGVGTPSPAMMWRQPIADFGLTGVQIQLQSLLLRNVDLMVPLLLEECFLSLVAL